MTGILGAWMYGSICTTLFLIFPVASKAAAVANE